MIYHRKWCKDTLLALRERRKPIPYHIFLSWSGGVGKSHLIKLIHHDTGRLLKLARCINPEDVTVLLTAPTCVAAYNISGMTLHSAFFLKPSRFGFNYLPLAAEKQALMEKALHSMQLLIIDEVSMAGAQRLFSMYTDVYVKSKAHTDHSLILVHGRRVKRMCMIHSAMSQC